MSSISRAPKGVFAALATPVDSWAKLDLKGLEGLVAHITKAPVNGVCPVGSTGEGPLLDRETRMEVTRRTVEQLDGSLSVIPATVSVTERDVVADIEGYAALGATHVLVPPPYYYPLSAGSIGDFYHRLAADSPLPILLYNIPQMTKISIPPSLVAELAEEENVVGIKDSSRDFEYFASVTSATSSATKGDFSVLTGSDTMLAASMLVGGDGTIAASVNLVPELVCEVYRAWVDNEYQVAMDLQGQLLKVVQACRPPSFPVGWKAALSLLGLCERYMVGPVRPASDSEVEALADSLISLGIQAKQTN